MIVRPARAVYLLLAAATLVAAGACLALLAEHEATFRDYSSRFGALAPGEFERLNERMDRLRSWSRIVVFGLVFPLDVSTVVFASLHWRRSRSVVALIVAIFAVLFGVALAGLLALAAAMPRGGMIG